MWSEGRGAKKLTWAGDPSIRINNVDLAFGLGEFQTPAREDGYKIIPNKEVTVQAQERGGPSLTCY